jgi:PEP-CTERM motif
MRVAKTETKVTRMNKTARHALAAAAVLAGAMGAAAPANAQFMATICNDIACTGGDDFSVTDNLAGDTSAIVGAISFSVAAFGYNFLVNTSQSKPVVGSATSPQLDLTFTATTTGAAGTVFLYTSDNGFTLAPGSSLLTVGGTNSNGSGSVTARAWGGSNNTSLSFSGANLIGSAIGPLTSAMFSGSNTAAFTPTANPYSLTIGTQISRASAGTTTGDLNLQISPVPEPSTWALMLMGPALIGFVARRRRKI